MTSSPEPFSTGLFAGTAWHYARYRPSYPQPFLDDLVERFHLDRTGRLLDLGCGTGQLTIPLAPHVAEAVGIDPEPEMLAEAAEQAQAAGLANATWAQGSSTDLPGEFGQFRLVTMGRSFHWMDREQVLTALDSMVDGDGAIVLANDSCLVRPITPWQQTVEDIQRRFVPAELMPPPLPGRLNASTDHQPHEQILARSPFRQVDRLVYEFDRPWTIEQVIGYLYSTSLPLRRLLGNRRTAFEQEVTDRLQTLEPNEPLIEPVTLEVLIGTKRQARVPLPHGMSNDT
ncbi:class I SAM-dependent methyltransferase [Nocardia pseudovaccinii]|uniref:class I SAM-dependent methyltransferase n=1 Tax=Nocardia pseudovaccinii TaxID=189540 RepID=UPI0007A43B3D|nr:class I SAM-dependent methyltransferase [Nocardia pseudovaccinii]